MNKDLVRAARALLAVYSGITLVQSAELSEAEWRLISKIFTEKNLETLHELAANEEDDE